MRKLMTLALGTFVLFLTASRWDLQAQQITGSIHGTVTDASGGGVPDAEVKATNVQTQVVTTVHTQGDGTFRFLNLPVGSYDVTVTKPGFRTQTTRNITLALNQDYDASAKLEVGQVTESVQVEANPVQVETTNTQLDTVIQGQTIVDMPLNGRNWTALELLLPGVMASSDRMGTGAFATNGSETQQNSFLINGADAIDLPLNTPSVIPSPDAIAEFNLVTSTINPEYGRNSGGILNAIIKSGTNSFHGDAFEFYRDTFLNGRNLYQASGPVFHQNQFGGTFGGPIIKNHTFFFLSYQDTRSRSPQAGNTTTVFTTAQRSGVFSDIARSTATSPFPLVGENGTTYPAGTPYSTIFPTGHIPSGDINPIASKLLSTYVPAANVGSNLYSFNPVVTGIAPQGIARIDHTMAHDAIWVDLFFQHSPSTSTIPFTGATLPGFTEVDVLNRKNLQADWTHTFNASTLNELRASWLRYNYNAVGVSQVTQPSSLGFAGVNSQFPQYASVPFISLTGFFSLGFSTNGPQPRIDSTYELADNFSKVIGQHSMKFGFDGKRYNVDNPFAFQNNGAFSFGGNGPYSTGDPGADFLLGIPDSYSQSSGGSIFAQSYEYYFYAQDSWKVRKDLTFNYGIGYQIDTPVKNTSDGGLDLNCFIPGQQSTIFPTAPVGLDFPGDKGCTASGYHSHYDHLAPRFGFAYSPDWGWLTGGSGKTVIRAGFGIYYNRTEEELTLQNLLAPPFGVISSGIGDVGGNPSFSKPFTDIATGQSIPNKFPFAAPQRGANIDFSFYEPFGLNVLNPNFTAPYAMNYNLNIQRQLPGAMILQVGYVGSQGRHLEIVYEANPITPAGQAACAASASCIANRLLQAYLYPTHTAFAPGNIFGDVGEQATAGNSSYNSLQVGLTKRMSHGLQFQVSYTYSHSIDDTSGYENSSGNLTTNPYNFALDRGDSGFDARHRFVASYDWELPSIAHSNRILHSLVDGWTVSGITTLQTGFPLEIYDSSERSLLCNGIDITHYGCPDTAQYLGNGVATYDARTSVNSKTAATPNSKNLPYYWFDPNAFGHPAYGTLGSEGRNNFHGPGINNTDLALLKRFHFSAREQRLVELRLESFNVFNHTQFNAPSANVNSVNFGRTLGAVAGRVVQLGAKVYF